MLRKRVSGSWPAHSKRSVVEVQNDIAVLVEVEVRLESFLVRRAGMADILSETVV